MQFEDHLGMRSPGGEAAADPTEGVESVESDMPHQRHIGADCCLDQRSGTGRFRRQQVLQG